MRNHLQQLAMPYDYTIRGKGLVISLKTLQDLLMEELGGQKTEFHTNRVPSSPKEIGEDLIEQEFDPFRINRVYELNDHKHR